MVLSGEMPVALPPYRQPLPLLLTGMPPERMEYPEEMHMHIRGGENVEKGVCRWIVYGCVEHTASTTWTVHTCVQDMMTFSKSTRAPATHRPVCCRQC